MSRGELTSSVEHEDHVLAECLARSQSSHEHDQHSVLTLRFGRRLRNTLVGLRDCRVGRGMLDRRSAVLLVRVVTVRVVLVGVRVWVMSRRCESSHHELLVQSDLGVETSACQLSPASALMKLQEDAPEVG